ncbi:integrase [Amycolatopsis sp. NPDC059021]|uniref:integrase n=1 Tax=Amycolatopsis sp. NPDC059021 TaxID=3346704 RepID=UPI00366FD6AA
MSTALDHDPYLLPMPTPASLVVQPHRVVPEHAHLNSRYDAPVWSLAPLIANPSTSKHTIRWKHCLPGFRDEVRLLAWNLINGELRPTFLSRRGSHMRSRLGAYELRHTVTAWTRMVTWLQARDVHSLSRCSTGLLHHYGQHLLATHSRRDSVLKVLVALTRLWAFDQLSAYPLGIGRPPWEDTGLDDYLPVTGSPSGENTTEPLSEQTVGPLLVWARRMVEDLAADILAAWARRQHLIDTANTTVGTAATRAALHAYLDPLIATGAPIPSTVHRGRALLARSYISGLTGASARQINHFARHTNLSSLVRTCSRSCPLDVPVTGQIAGRPWRGVLDFTEIPTLMRHLGTAAFIVCAYLTGMRPGEVLGLRAGCCPDPEPDATGTPGRHLIHGNEYKTATDEHGNHLSAGVEREVPWVAIAPVVTAIRVLERMVPADALLFDHNVHDVRTRPGTGSLGLHSLRSRIDDFVTWANTEATAHGLNREIILADPYGRIGTARFRRSLAWHIARRPGGLVALAIQYGHLRTAVSGNYASRGRGGIHELINVETARAVADTVADLNDDLEAGGGVSGPAARRAIKAAVTAPSFAGTLITATTARRLLTNEDAMLYDNPHALLLCHYKRDRALCHRDGVRDTPSLDHCVPGCGNIVRTDRHAELLRERANVLDTRATHVPGPLGDRLRANAGKLRSHADTHDHTRITKDDA